MSVEFKAYYRVEGQESTPFTPQGGLWVLLPRKCSKSSFFKSISEAEKEFKRTVRQRIGNANAQLVMCPRGIFREDECFWSKVTIVAV